MPTLFKFFLPLLFWPLLAGAPQAMAADDSRALCDTVSSLLQPGDIVFIDIDNAIFRRIARATGGWANHVGVILEQTPQGWTIAQSKPPVSQSEDFCRFLKRGSHDRLAVRRHTRFWTSSDMDLIKKEALARMGIAYDLKFNFDSKKQYCSKFVYEIYQAALGIEIGTISTIGELMDGMQEQPTYQQDLAFWRIYFGGKIPRAQRILTPESQYQDPRLMTVFDNSGL